MVVCCKRCGRVLKSPKSIKLGYGPTCYRLIKLHDNPLNIQEEIKFLKVEMNMLKKILRELKADRTTSYHTAPIIDIKKEESSSGRDVNKYQMIEVIQELKNCFQVCNGDVKRLLKPIQIETNLIKTSQLAAI